MKQSTSRDPVYGILTTLLAAFVFLCAFFHISGVDPGFHIRTGAHLLETRSIPAVNTFSYTQPDHTWFLQQWAPATVFYLVYQVWDIAGLIIFKALLAVILLFLVFLCARQEAGPRNLWPLWIATCGALMARFRFLVRPFMFSAILFALTLYLDRKYDRRRCWQWLFLPLLMGIWAHTHAGVLYGFVLLCTLTASEWLDFLWTARQRQRRGDVPWTGADFARLLIRPGGIVLSLVVSVVSLELINPNGIKVMLVPIEHFSNPFWQSMVHEYFPRTWRNAKLFYLSLPLLALLQTATLRHLRLRLLLPALAMAYFACRSQRSILIYMITAAPYAAHMLKVVFPLTRRTTRIAHKTLLPIAWTAVVAFLIVPDKTYLFGVGLYPRYYPTEVYRFIRQAVPRQNIFNDMRYGGGMLWWLYPDFRPFIDGRGTAYAIDFWETQYLPSIDGEPVWREVFARYDVTAALLWVPRTREVSRLGRTLFDDPQWALVAYTDSTILFLQRTEANQRVISDNEHRLIWPGDWSFSTIAPDTLDEAYEEAQRAYRRSPAGDHARTAFARASLVKGDFATACRLYEALTAIGGAGDGYWRDYGYALYRSGQFEKAEAVFSQMIEKDLASGFAYYMKHFIALKRGDLKRADACLARASEMEPDNGDYAAARKDLEAALSAR